jgi:hypothetical protein
MKRGKAPAVVWVMFTPEGPKVLLHPESALAAFWLAIDIAEYHLAAPVPKKSKAKKGVRSG